MDDRNMIPVSEVQICARCMHGRKNSRRIITSKNRLICILSFATTISITISLFTLWMYFLMHVRVSLHDTAIDKLQTDYQILAEKYDSLAGKNDGVQDEFIERPDNTVHVDNVQSHEEGYESATMTYKDDPSKHSVVKRQANKKPRKGRGKNSKKHKKGMTYIQIEGAGTQKKQQDKNGLYKMDIGAVTSLFCSKPYAVGTHKNRITETILMGTNNIGFAVTGFWSSPTWLKRNTKRFKAAEKAFKFDEINRTGKLRVRKPGIYLVYAQFTLVGNPITGFHVSLSHSANNTEKLLQCTRFSNTTHDGNTQSCFTMGIVELGKDDEIFIQENQTNEGANYSKISYFGLIRMGD